MATDLLLCPFCGQPARVLPGAPYSRGDGVDWAKRGVDARVVCPVPEGGCGASTGYAENEAHAVTKWNRRAEVQP